VITLVSDLGFVQIPRTDTAPVLGNDFAAAAFAHAAVIRTERHISGPDGASAEVRALWSDHTGTDSEYAQLHLLIHVDDATPDVSSPEDHLQDSVEVFVGLAPNRGAPTDLYDAQFRVSRAGNLSFGQGNNAIQAQRISFQTVDNGTDGWMALITIDMRTDTGHLQGQWNDGLSGLGSFHNFEIQLNDATPQGRGVHGWGGNDTGWGSTARLGVMEFVETIDDAGMATPGLDDGPDGTRWWHPIRDFFSRIGSWFTRNGS
jgi:endo-1,4-beta-xylanase